jgi:hypothetical protein
MNGFYRVLVRSQQDGIKQLNDVIVVAANMTEAELLAAGEIEDRLGALAWPLHTRTMPIEPDVPRVVAVEFDVPG